MVDTLRYLDWINNAERDLNAANILFEHECGNDLVAFHCQQCVEKSLKSFLIAKGKGIISTHSLIYLCKLCESIDSSFKQFIKDCGFLNQYYIETRYPADDPIIIDDYEIHECIKISSEIFTHVLNLLK
ncbi:MAG: HEPN domain-containing protein [Sedimentibacter sp.]